ncbi:hypothetical protein BP6252_12985 [Coleophoma cylindrospora]|uniref:Uncharacterized protein n=1 Tax=Coleophoma cylindrospora TaxID=1849047 RepID=A0A3D8QE44_9HELO|nr:hypothetical protein BP6252_12985 [Coleophoma cylindrospora]
MSASVRFDEEAGEALLKDKSDNVLFVKRKTRHSYEIVLPWALASFFFCTTLFFAWKSSVTVSGQHSTYAALGSYEEGFATDFGIIPLYLFEFLVDRVQVSILPKVPINVVQKKFTNDLLYNTTSGKFYNQPLSLNETKYIGESDSAVDDAWERLLHAQYVAMDPEEAKQIPESHISPLWYDGEHEFFELSVFHNLHCLNEIRMSLAGNSHDNNRDTLHEGNVHLDHCVDQIRQALMCHADLTPVPMHAVAGAPDHLALGNGEMHTCRDFDAIWAWVEERGKKQRALGD